MRTTRLLIGVAALAMPIALAGPAAATVSVPADCVPPPEAGIDLSQFNIIIGTNASQTIRGTERADFICARLGNDTIFAGGGSDVILGDSATFFGDPTAPGGNDVVFAGSGNDQVLSGPGNDRAYGSYGADFIALAVGDDYGDGGPGADDMNGGFGVDTLSGGDGNDVVAGGPDKDVVYGGPGRDTLYGELPGGGLPPNVPGARDTCNGGSGADTGVDCDIRQSL
jgi:Ca2+-binding RTX toxin-like protein